MEYIGYFFGFIGMAFFIRAVRAAFGRKDIADATTLVVCGIICATITAFCLNDTVIESLCERTFSPDPICKSK